MSGAPLHTSPALWNRSTLDLSSDEILAQLLDRGDMPAWRELYRLATTDVALRSRIKRIISSVPTPLPRFWLAALAGLGEVVDFDAPLPDYYLDNAI